MIFLKIGIFDKTIKKIIGNLRKIVFEFDTFLYSFKKSFKVTELLYSLSHSLVIFAIVIISIYIIKRKVLYVLLGWGLHIILDILTHTKEFFPTPFLYPLSNFLINGITWRQNWFLITNYIVLTTIFTYLYRKELFKFIKKLRILRSK